MWYQCKASIDVNNSMVWCNPYSRSPRRMNVCDGSPVKQNFQDELEKHRRGVMPLSRVPELLNQIEQMCFVRYFLKQPLSETASVFLVPVKQHMPPRSRLASYGATRRSRSASFHTHHEMWVCLVVVSRDRAQQWMWFVKRESELMSETEHTSLDDFLLSDVLPPAAV